MQTSGMHNDITANTAINNVMTKDAIIACDFSGDVLEGVDRGEEFQRDAYTLRSMRTDFALFNRQLGILSGNELRIFKGYKVAVKTHTLACGFLLLFFCLTST